MSSVVPSDSSNNEYDREYQNVCVAIGRGVLFYQRMELILKTMLPYLIPRDGRICDDPFVEMEKLLESRETLGPLMERFKQSMHSPYPESYSEYLARIVANRNQLVHSFVRLPFGRLGDVPACQEALRHLESHRIYALPFLESLQELISSLTELPDQGNGSS